MTTKTMTRSALSVALIAISAQISLHLGLVPFTLQVFSLSLLAHLLSKEEQILTISTYVILGLIGLPIFAKGQGGMMMLSQASFGFIIGFIPFILLLRKHPIIAYLILYTIGLTYLVVVVKVVYQAPTAIPILILQYGLMFLPSDLISIYVAKRLANSTILKKIATD